MVDDPGTDSVISWSCRGDSFIVWDPHNSPLIICPNTSSTTISPALFANSTPTYASLTFLFI
ncbi:heat shock factor protein hsf8 [Phtheirospermum japonicum]|uniref:Heat shock factor protein hsf8 n=1 Tax=Phtheirospermum japonicum TaxID=374723 RepID=A0A830BHF6_9LAMI|nr:heat shock factor protein hsf8 [Phtheirospermum japonicum]